MVTVCFTLHDLCKALALIALENQSLTPKLEKNAVKKSVDQRTNTEESILNMMTGSTFIQDTCRPRGYKTFFVLSSMEHKIFLAHKC